MPSAVIFSSVNPALSKTDNSKGLPVDTKITLFSGSLAINSWAMAIAGKR
jgi:hypothetical protein